MDLPDDIPDAVTLGQRMLSLGIVTHDQLTEAREEAGARNPDVGALLRILERKTYLTPWQSAKLLKGDIDGFLLGGYRLLYKIQSGSFGRVFRADDPRSGRVVAVKVLRRRWSEDQLRVDLFAREAKLGMTLKHPNIVEVLAVGKDASSEQHYIVMEFVEGGNLREILQIRQTLSVAEALRVLEDAAAGLAYAYSRGLTHRDMKLTNILVSGGGTAKLVDFGLAQFYAIIEGDKRHEKMERTVDYAGLERATNVKTGDVRSDIYFLGCVFFETLMGRSPLEVTRNKMARMSRSRFEDVVPLRREELEAPPSVFALLETMMSLQPQARYQTPSQLVDSIKAARRDVEGKAARGGGKEAGPRAVFIAESDERLQDAMRERFKEKGFRVFMAADPVRALDRFRQQPYEALIVDAGTTGHDGLLVFERVLSEARQKGVDCAGILVLSAEQADWAGSVKVPPRAAVLVRPIGLKQLYRKLQELLQEGE